MPSNAVLARASPFQGDVRVVPADPPDPDIACSSVLSFKTVGYRDCRMLATMWRVARENVLRPAVKAALPAPGFRSPDACRDTHLTLINAIARIVWKMDRAAGFSGRTI
jgi:hypothetical protein